LYSGETITNALAEASRLRNPCAPAGIPSVVSSEPTRHCHEDETSGLTARASFQDERTTGSTAARALEAHPYSPGGKQQPRAMTRDARFARMHEQDPLEFARVPLTSIDADDADHSALAIT
jgi:hypothetical protein